jgi:hypothetical protein
MQVTPAPRLSAPRPDPRPLQLPRGGQSLHCRIIWIDDSGTCWYKLGSCQGIYESNMRERCIM